MSILFLSDSLLTTIQDLGRSGFRSSGVNPNGAMDKKAVRLINILLGHDENEAVLEIHFPSPKILFESDATIAIGGADFGAKISGTGIKNWSTHFVKKGQTLSFPAKNKGNRAYLSVKGGFKIESWLNSKSTNLKAKIGGFNGSGLKKNDRLFFKSGLPKTEIGSNLQISRNLIPNYSNAATIRVIAGNEFESLTGLCEQVFLKTSFQIDGNSDRMGFRLRGEGLYLIGSFELASSAVDFGTVQLLPNGQMILLMADHQTTGGYPRIAHIISEDLPIAAQLGANDRISFELVSFEEAENLALKFEKDLSFLKMGCRFKAK